MDSTLVGKKVADDEAGIDCVSEVMLFSLRTPRNGGPADRARVQPERMADRRRPVNFDPAEAEAFKDAGGSRVVQLDRGNDGDSAALAV